MKTKFVTSWAIGVALGSLACASTTTVYDYQIEQKALVPTNAAPRATGPLAEPTDANMGLAYIEGGLQLGVVEQVGGRDARLTGHEVPLVQGHVRGAFALADDIELGISGRYANGALAASSARRPREPDLEHAHTGGVGMQLRARPFGDAYLGLLLGLEGGVDLIPMQRDVYTTQTDIISQPEGDWTREYPERLTTTRHMDTVGSLGAQLALQGAPLPGVSGELGVRVSTQPKYFGARNTAEVCTSGGFSDSCDGTNPSDVPRSQIDTQGTVFAGAMFEVAEGAWSVGARGWWTPWGAVSLARAAPGGGELTVRVNLE